MVRRKTCMNSNWLSQPTDLTLSAEHLDLWCIRLDLPEELVKLLAAKLNDEEQARADKFLLKQKAREFIVSRTALRSILAGLLQCTPNELMFKSGTHGKPYLVNNSLPVPLYFNLAHSDELALIAVSTSGQIGIDLEKIRPDIDHDNLSRRFFSAREYAALQQISDQNRLTAFFATWTRKEAVVKATGKGIATSLKQFDVTVDPAQIPQILPGAETPEEITSLSLTTVNVGTEYYATLATSSNTQRLPHIRHWIFEH